MLKKSPSIVHDRLVISHRFRATGPATANAAARGATNAGSRSSATSASAKVAWRLVG